MTSYDEAEARPGEPRPHYAEILAATARAGPRALAREASQRAARAGLDVNGADLRVDPVPRVLPAEEWEPLAAGLARRAQVLDALVAGAYETAAESPLRAGPYFEPELVDAPPPSVAVGLVGFDVIRGPDGAFRVLEDNVLTPGHVFLPAARDTNPLAERVATAPRPVHDATRDALCALLGEDAAILGDAPPRWELRRLGELLDVPVVTPGELRSSSGGIWRRSDGRRFATLWQRTAEDRLRDDAGGLTAIGALLLAPLVAGTVRTATRMGAGVVHDKRALPVVAAALGPDTRPAPVPTLVLARPEDRETLFADPAAFVVKPATGAGGRGVRFGRDVPAAELRALVDADPDAWVAQPVVELSVHPTVQGDRLEPRPVDLRVFAIHTGAGWTVLPGGVSRFPTRSGSGIVNTSAGGGIKDVWVMP